jgi:uncharacterized protein (TIGR01777 family)
VYWDGKSVGDWAGELNGADAVVNLAGQSVNCRYHARNRRRILESRVGSTLALGEAIRACSRPPRVWLNSSTATLYKHSFDRPMDEASGVIAGTPEAKDQFSVEVGQAWEAAMAETSTPNTRKVALRTAMVFGVGSGGVYRVLRRLASCGFGGAMAGGRQYVSWIHETDFCRAVEWLFANGECAGPVNLAAPRPLTNREMMRTVRRACGMPIGLPAAGWMLNIGAVLLRTETELMIKSRRVVPGRLTAAGFRFLYSELGSAVKELEERLALSAGVR